MKIVVTGGRDQTDYNAETLVFITLRTLSPDEIFVGDCPTGVDFFTNLHFKHSPINRTTVLNVFKANWDKHGKSAGPIRNREMLEAAGKDAIVIAFPGGRGTENCVKQAKELGMIVLRVEL